LRELAESRCRWPSSRTPVSREAIVYAVFSIE
jgi:hypothetical protein